VQGDHSAIQKRVSRVLGSRLRPACYRYRVPLQVELGPVSADPLPSPQAIAGEYRDFAVGRPWGAPWSTSWFRLTGTIPADWTDVRVEAVVDLGFERAWPGKQAEALAYDADATPIKAVQPRNRHIPISAAPGSPVELYLEAAANPELLSEGFEPTPLGDSATAGNQPLYRLRAADLAVLDTEVFGLVLDVEVLVELMRELDAGRSRRHEIARALSAALDALDLHDVSGTAVAARARLADVLAKPAEASAHHLHAMGHAHIDSAWLWPLRETPRKASRTFANVTQLAEDYPELVFVASQAQQYAWVEEHQPKIFERIRAAVDKGTWVPVGGMWVESDANLPGGEALARQFGYGTRYFADRFGTRPDCLWLPDSFGYSAALPQIAKLAGMNWFLTQKMSWNSTNTLPHHTFLWEGIDGSRLFTHFPPVDSYNVEFTAAQLAHAERGYAEKGTGSVSVAPFGYGDGGGGPTREMMERARRLRDLEGSPRVSIGTPEEFLRTARAEIADPAVWRGELYLEFHRGTYTSQQKMKAGNRICEHLLRAAELWCTTAALRAGSPYPYDDIERLWKTVLLHQFHDILPGSSIAWVHREARETYDAVREELGGLIDRALSALGSSGHGAVFYNAGPFARTEVVACDGQVPGGQALRDGRTAVVVEVPSLGSGSARREVPDGSIVRSENIPIVLDNELIRLEIDENGLIGSVLDHRAGRELVPVGRPANLLQIHPDHPVEWDAWDIDEYYRNTVTDLVDADSVEVVDDGPLLGSVRIVRRFGRSTMDQTVTLRAGSRRIDIRTEIDWHESEKVLKAAFPLDIHADLSSAEIQFGHVQRPTHTNTSWDTARFEVYHHRWVHVGEHGYGATLLTDSTYGHDIRRTTREDGGTTTIVRLTLLRAPRCPDPEADQGSHTMTYALSPGATVADAVAEGYALNLPLVCRNGGAEPLPSLLDVDNPAVVVEAVKLAEDRSGDVVVRLYEALGGRAKARLTPAFVARQANLVDLVEEPLGAAEFDAGAVRLDFRPFEIKTLRLTVG
jgi:alpha-mannosidase